MAWFTDELPAQGTGTTISVRINRDQVLYVVKGGAKDCIVHFVNGDTLQLNIPIGDLRLRDS
jgi:hypothetical protein